MHPAHGGDDPADFAPVHRRRRALAARLRSASGTGGRTCRRCRSSGPSWSSTRRRSSRSSATPRSISPTPTSTNHGTIDDPRDTVAAAPRRRAADARGGRGGERPAGPCSTPSTARSTASRTRSGPCRTFDDEYFRHMQWAHLASGGAGGGMRWPNRHPHVLTRGMRAAQRALARFPRPDRLDRFRRRNLQRGNARLRPRTSPRSAAAMRGRRSSGCCARMVSRRRA